MRAGGRAPAGPCGAVPPAHPPTGSGTLRHGTLVAAASPEPPQTQPPRVRTPSTQLLAVCSSQFWTHAAVSGGTALSSAGPCACAVGQGRGAEWPHAELRTVCGKCGEREHGETHARHGLPATPGAKAWTPPPHAHARPHADGISVCLQDPRHIPVCFPRSLIPAAGALTAAPAAPLMAKSQASWTRLQPIQQVIRQGEPRTLTPGDLPPKPFWGC